MTVPAAPSPAVGRSVSGVPAGVYCALDTVDLDRATTLARLVAPHVTGLKIGLEFFLAHGAAGYRAIADHAERTGLAIFLDLKLHDIPNTVAGALRAVVPLAPRLITLHTSGGPAMMTRAVEEAANDAEKAGVVRPALIGVTVLTSLDAHDLAAVGQVADPQAQVLRLAGLAQASGLDGVVCSPAEIAAIRAATDPDFALVVPGLRPGGVAAGDQKRVMTPRAAHDLGATVLVVGRAITAAADPAAAAASIAGSLA